MKIFAGSASHKLAKAICEYLKIELGDSETINFSEGNIFVRIKENVRGRDIFIVQSICYPVNDNFMELLFWIDAFKRASADQVTVVVPFFSYAKGDKKDEPRVSIRARVCADAIEVTGADRVLTMDLHSPQIQGFFKIPVDHLYALPVICDRFKEEGMDNDLVVVSPDLGFGKQARKYAIQLSASVAIGTKERPRHDERAEILQVIGEVEGKNALIVDDFTISGRSLVEVAKVLERKGACDIQAAVTHGVLSAGAVERINDSPIRKLIITDTIEHSSGELGEKIEVLSVVPLFGEAILSIHERTSISRLFPPGL